MENLLFLGVLILKHITGYLFILSDTFAGYSKKKFFFRQKIYFLKLTCFRSVTWDIYKQCRSSSDVAKCSISAGSTLFAEIVICFRFEIYLLTLEAPNKICSRQHFNILLLSFEENKV